MPTTVNFSSLLADLANYLERGGSDTTDPTVFNQLPRLINAAERKLAQDLKLLGQIEVLVDTPAGLQMGNAVVTKPDRWRSTVSLCYGAGSSLDTRTYLFERSLEVCTAYWPNRTQTAPPEIYCDYSYSHWLVSPTPDQNYPLEAVCYCQPRLLDAENSNNFWTQYCPNALLYFSLLEAAPFLKDDPRVATWQAFADREVQTLSGQDLQRILDRASDRKAP